jgi:SAM-dependent methyltransferase
MMNERNSGYCHCCRLATNFIVTGDWLRDQYLCETCKSIPRQRHLQWVLDRFFSGWDALTVHESSPSNDFISRFCPGYTSSHFFEGFETGTTVNGIRCENLEKLTFPDSCFDIFVTQDVFEHVFNPDRAAREIMRVLRPGGAHVFTAPKHSGLNKSYPRAKLLPSGIEYLMDEVYHGNPVGDGRALVTWDYGDDFEYLMHQWCGYPCATYITHDRSLGIDGEFIEVFVSRKVV